MKRIYKLTINDIDRHFSSKAKVIGYLTERYIVENNFDIEIAWLSRYALVWDKTNDRQLGAIRIIEVL